MLTKPARALALLPLHRLACILALGCTASALAAPAPWFVWRSKLDGREHCAQTSPGQGWERVRGPYRDLRCSQPVSLPTAPPGLR